MATPEERSRAARIAAHSSWAQTPDRRERTQPATNASPVSLEYWEKKLREEGVVREEDISKAAVNARSAEMRRRALKSAKARARNRAEKLEYHQNRHEAWERGWRPKDDL
ncbi:hypothetical protein GCM10022419_008150 [Nonomuraea rosea]|uniref:Uncharacterized protein n=2 Tax=Nonomuraea rosea TaxID=638574 RepID=A0ABP6VB37_9ACTN